jgi:hypothetical protein
MSGAIPHSPTTSSWRGAQLKQRNNFTFTFLYVVAVLLISSVSSIFIFVIR